MLKPMKGLAPTKPLTQFPYMASAKVDGMRALVKDGKVYSKSMKLIPNRQVQELFGHLHGADAEITVGPAFTTHPDDDVFDRSRGPIMRKDCEADFQIYIFDRWDMPDIPAIERVVPTRFASGWEGRGGNNINFLVQTLVHSQEEVDVTLERHLAEGFEGSMLRQVDSPYKYGQATEKEGYLFKNKPFQTSTAVILAVIEQMENTNEATKDELGRTKRSSSKAGKVGKGTFGAFLVRDVKTNVEFSVGMGPGLDDALRAHFWSIKETLPGQFIYYRFQECGTKTAPRLPAFLRIRDKIDVAEAGL